MICFVFAYLQWQGFAALLVAGSTKRARRPRPYETMLIFAFCFPPHAILDVVVDDEVQLLVCKTVMLRQHTVALR
jgi:hypothetical protein